MGNSAFEKHYRVKEHAVLWGLSPKTVSRIFAEETGVIQVVNYGTSKRRYATLSIPESVASRVHDRLRNQLLQENPPGIQPIRIIRLRDVESGTAGKGRTMIKLRGSFKSERIINSPPDVNDSHS